MVFAPSSAVRNAVSDGPPLGPAPTKPKVRVTGLSDLFWDRSGRHHEWRGRGVCLIASKVATCQPPSATFRGASNMLKADGRRSETGLGQGVFDGHRGRAGGVFLPPPNGGRRPGSRAVRYRPRGVERDAASTLGVAADRRRTLARQVVGEHRRRGHKRGKRAENPDLHEIPQTPRASPSLARTQLGVTSVRASRCLGGSRVCSSCFKSHFRQTQLRDAFSSGVAATESTGQGGVEFREALAHADRRVRRGGWGRVCRRLLRARFRRRRGSAQGRVRRVRR